LITLVTTGKEENPTTDGLEIRCLSADELERFTRPHERVLLARWLEQQERGEVYIAVAWIDGVPVGRRCLDFTNYGDQGIGFGFAASVRPEWRSRGIASRIDRHLEQVARERGLHALRSVAAKDNDRAVRWHERQGDRRTGERVLSWTEADGREVEVDCWTFERPLG
jgi:GNAT superfamily N-acetyltransferase